MYYIVCVFSKKTLNAPSFCFVLFGVSAWGNIRVQYNGGLLPDIMTGLDAFRFLFDMYSICACEKSDVLQSSQISSVSEA